MGKVNKINQKKIYRRYRKNADIVLFCGDAYEFVKKIPDKSVGLVIASPPYNIGKKYEKKVALQKYLDAQSDLISQLYRVLKVDGSICWQVGNYVQNGEIFPLDIFYYQMFKNAGLFLRNRIIWHYRHGLHASRRFSGRYETLLWFTKSDDYVFNLDLVRTPSKYPGKRYYKGPKKGKLSGNPNGKNPSDVWEFLFDDWKSGFWDIPNVKAKHPEKTIHFCQFPVELVERCVLALTNKNDWVFDPFAGVGSSLIGAILHNRKALGSEKERKYHELAEERLKALMKGELKLRPLNKPIYIPNGREKVAQIPEEWTNSV